MTTETIVTACSIATVVVTLTLMPRLIYLLQQDLRLARSTTLDAVELTKVADELERLLGTVRALVPEDKPARARDRTGANA